MNDFRIVQAGDSVLIVELEERIDPAVNARAIAIAHGHEPPLDLTVKSDAESWAQRLRGRVMGFYSFVFVGLAPLGALEVGTLAERIGTPVAVALGGAATALAVGVAGWRVRELRKT